MKYLKLEDIKAYQIAFELSNYVWNIVIKWNYFARDTVGKQYVDATDSEYSYTKEKLDALPKEINSLIRYTNIKLLK